LTGSNTNLNISNNTIISRSGSSVFLGDEIIDSDFINNFIESDNRGVYGKAINSEVSYNTIMGPNGIDLSTGHDNMIVSNIINISKKEYNSIAITADGSFNVIKKNFCDGGYIGLYNGRNNTILMNTCNGTVRRGIELIQISDSRIIGNRVTNCGIGIKGSGISDIFIRNNDIENNRDYGIFLSGDNNTIFENRINNNGNYSIYINSYVPRISEGNVIYQNSINNNGGHNSQAYDKGSNNSWDNGKEGNYWSDYDGFDSNGDGIGEQVYNISGTANATDRYPLTKSTDLFNVTMIVNPNLAVRNQHVSIFVRVDHFYYWEDVEILLYVDDKEFDNVIMDLNGTSVFQFEWKASSNGEHEIRIVVKSLTTEEANTTIEVRSSHSDSTTSIPNTGYVLLAITTVLMATYRRQSF